MRMVEDSCVKADPDIHKWIFRSVTKGDTFGKFEAEGAPFGRSLFYDRLRRYFFELDKIRD